MVWAVPMGSNTLIHIEIEPYRGFGRGDGDGDGSVEGSGYGDGSVYLFCKDFDNGFGWGNGHGDGSGHSDGSGEDNWEWPDQ